MKQRTDSSKKKINKINKPLSKLPNYLKAER